VSTVNDCLPSGRNLPVDVFRGVTILLMIFVNELAGISDIPQWARHMPADADAMSFVDVVFPAFLFIVGLSLPFAVQARRTRGDSNLQILAHGLVRAASLIVIGVFMVNSSSGLPGELTPISADAWTLLMYVSVLLIWTARPETLNRQVVRSARILGCVSLVWLWCIYAGVDDRGMTVQWWGILGLIGWAYAIALPMYLLTQRVSVLAVLMVVLVGSYLALQLVANNDSVFVSWLAGNSGNLTHAAIVLGGMILGLLAYDTRYASAKSLFIPAYCAAAIILAFGTWQFSPISKIYATPSWGLFSIAACSLSFLILKWALDRSQKAEWARLFLSAARNPLLLYLLPYFFAALFGLFAWPPRPEQFDAGLAGVFWSVMFTIAVALIGRLLSQIGIRLRL
jgi:predicted acyltransferase